MEAKQTTETKGNNIMDATQTIEIGTIFINSWGYDQTNVDAYQVVEVTAKTVIVQQIETHNVSDGPQSMTGQASPMAGYFKGARLRKRIVARLDGEQGITFGKGHGFGRIHEEGETYRTSSYA